jgi:hypothetical protein
LFRILIDFKTLHSDYENHFFPHLFVTRTMKLQWKFMTMYVREFYEKLSSHLNNGDPVNYDSMKLHSSLSLHTHTRCKNCQKVFPHVQANSENWRNAERLPSFSKEWLRDSWISLSCVQNTVTLHPTRKLGEIITTCWVKILRKFLVRTLGFKICKFLDNKHLHRAWIFDATNFCCGRLINPPRLILYFNFFSNTCLHTVSCFQPRVLKTAP